jgi:hypothetical protein
MMALRKMSRRKFLESSLTSGLTVNMAWGSNPGRVAASTSITGSARLTLKVVGSAGRGYAVTILFDGQPITRHNSGGEFSAVFQNGERSLEDRAENWKATSWTGDATHVMLDGECKLQNLNTTVFAQVEYEVVTPRVVRKRIRLRQNDIYMLFYQVSNRLEAEESPAKFWSFNQADCQGGPMREYYPAAGFRTKNGVTVGLLTDSGYRNCWSRMIRRDGWPVKPAPKRIPDVNLNYVSRREERAEGEFFVQQTFGEALVQAEDDESGEAVALPPVSEWHMLGKVTLEEQSGATLLSPGSPEGGVVIPFLARDGEVYSVRLEYRSSQPFALGLWDLDERHNRLEDITLYNDRVPESPGGWSEFRSKIFVYALRGCSGALHISAPQSEQAMNRESPGGLRPIALRNLEVRRLKVRLEPYHRLGMGYQQEKTAFVFVDDKTPDTVRGYRLASQLHLAEALGFKGGETEKVLYSDLMMLCWIAGPQTVRPMCAPSIWYSAAGEMYLRDSFFALNGVHSRELNESVLNLWADNQGTNGQPGAQIERLDAVMAHVGALESPPVRHQAAHG